MNSIKFKPDFERLRKTVRREEPDRVPLCEVLIEYPIQSRFLGRTVASDDLEAQVEFWTQAGYDFIPVAVSLMNPGKVTDESPISRAIRESIAKDSSQDDGRSWNLEYTSFINDRRDFERFPWELAANLDFSVLSRIQTLLPEGMKVIVVSGKIYTLAWMLMGFNTFAISLILEETLVGDVIQKVADIQIRALDAIFGMPHVGGVWVVDDIAGNTGTMVSPQALRDHVFPWYRKMARRCHDNGMLFFMHSDGDLTAVMEDIITMGVDVLHPIDPSCMDIVRTKAQYGDRLSFAGNVSTELLRTGTPEQIDSKVKSLIEQVAPGGGYCAGSGNSVPEWARFENYMALREAVFRYGAYPIHLS